MTPYYITQESVEQMEWEQFESQMADADVLVTRLYGRAGRLPERVVIRGLDGDHEIAAVHRDGDVLVLDMGQPL